MELALYSGDNPSTQDLSGASFWSWRGDAVPSTSELRRGEADTNGQQLLPGHGRAGIWHPGCSRRPAGSVLPWRFCEAVLPNWLDRFSSSPYFPAVLTRAFPKPYHRREPQGSSQARVSRALDFYSSILSNSDQGHETHNLTIHRTVY